MDGQQWTTLHELLAINAELTDQWGLGLARLQGGGKALKGRKPLQIPRPSDPVASDKKDEVIKDPRVIAKFFA